MIVALQNMEKKLYVLPLEPRIDPNNAPAAVQVCADVFPITIFEKSLLHLNSTSSQMVFNCL